MTEYEKGTVECFDVDADGFPLLMIRMTDGIARRRLGRSALEVNTIGTGLRATLLLAGWTTRPHKPHFRRRTVAFATDTAPEYGFGLSEHRVGQFLRQRPCRIRASTKAVSLPQAPPDVSSTGRHSDRWPRFRVPF